MSVKNGGMMRRKKMQNFVFFVKKLLKQDCLHVIFRMNGKARAGFVQRFKNLLSLQSMCKFVQKSYTEQNAKTVMKGRYVQACLRRTRAAYQCVTLPFCRISRI